MAIKPFIFTIALGLAGSGLALEPTSAATLSASFGVTATVQASCTISASVLTIAARSGGNGTAGVSVACSHSIPYSLTINRESSDHILLGTRGLSRSDADLWRSAIISTSLQDSGQSGTPDRGAGAVAGKAVQTLEDDTKTPAARESAAGIYGDLVAVTVVY